MPALAARPRPVVGPDRRSARTAGRRERRLRARHGLAADRSRLGAVLAAVALEAGGGLQLGPSHARSRSSSQLAGGALARLAVLTDDARRRPRRRGARAASALLAALTALSIALGGRSPPTRWLETNRTLAYLAVFAAGVALVRLAGDALGRARSAPTCWRRGDRLRLRAADQGLPGVAGRRRDLRPAARAVRLLERRRADRRARRPRLPVARARAARATPRSTPSPTPSSALLLVAVLLAYSRGALLAAARRLRVLVRRRAAAPARRRRAGARAPRARCSSSPGSSRRRR